MVRNYLKAFSRPSDYISLLIITVLYVGFSHLVKQYIDLNLIDLVIYSLIINAAMSYLSLSSEENKRYYQFSNTLPLGELIKTKKSFIESIPVFLMLVIFSIIYDRNWLLIIMFFPFLSLGTLPFDIKDKDLVLIDKVFMGIYYGVVIILLGIINLTDVFNVSSSMVVMVLFLISTAIFWINYNNKYNVRRWRNG